MKRPRTTGSRGKVPYLHDKQIEAEAQLLLDEYALDRDCKPAIPVPVEEIVELHLHLAFDIEDLQELFNVPDVLGAIWFAEKIVRVDVRLDPALNPSMLGRFRFTVAHEAGHWRLHRRHYVEDPSQGKLFNGRGQPAFICRSSVRPPAEIQADRFAACLLMPRELVRAAWQAWRGSLDSVALQQLPPINVHTDPKLNANAAMERFCRPLAERFEVSAEAMRIRLESIGLLQRFHEPRLFQ